MLLLLVLSSQLGQQCSAFTASFLNDLLGSFFLRSKLLFDPRYKLFFFLCIR